MARIVFDGKILHDRMLDDVQVRVEPQDSNRYQAIATVPDADPIVLHTAASEKAAKDYVNRLGKVMADAEEIPDVVLMT